MAKYKKRPVVIEAVQTAHSGATFDGPFSDTPEWLSEALQSGVVSLYDNSMNNAQWQIKTLEDGPTRAAKHIATPGDWIIQGVSRELYFCKPDIFAKTYEAVE